jgi:hypothetical protein
MILEEKNPRNTRHYETVHVKTEDVATIPAGFDDPPEV